MVDSVQLPHCLIKTFSLYLCKSGKYTYSEFTCNYSLIPPPASRKLLTCETRKYCQIAVLIPPHKFVRPQLCSRVNISLPTRNYRSKANMSNISMVTCEMNILFSNLETMNCYICNLALCLSLDILCWKIEICPQHSNLPSSQIWYLTQILAVKYLNNC